MSGKNATYATVKHTPSKKPARKESECFFFSQSLLNYVLFFPLVNNFYKEFHFNLAYDTLCLTHSQDFVI